MAKETTASMSAAPRNPSSPTASTAASTRSRPIAPELSLPTRRRLIRKPLPGIPGSSSLLASGGSASGPGGIAAMRERVKKARETNKADDENALGWWPDTLPPCRIEDPDDDEEEEGEENSGAETDTAKAAEIIECGLDDQSAAHLRTLLTYSIAYHPPELASPEHSTARSQLAPALYLSLLAALEHLSHPALVAALQRTAAMRWRAEQQLRAEAAAAAAASAAAAAASSGAGSSALLARWARLGWSAAAGGARNKGSSAVSRSASAPIPAPFIPSSLLGYSSAYHGPLSRIEGVNSMTTEETSAEHEQRLRKRDVALKILSNAVWFARTYSTPGAFGMASPTTPAPTAPEMAPRHASAQLIPLHDRIPPRASTPAPPKIIRDPQTPTPTSASSIILRSGSSSATRSAAGTPHSSRPSSSSAHSFTAGGGGVTPSLGAFIARPTPTTALSVSGLDDDDDDRTASEASSRRGSIIEHDVDDDDDEMEGDEYDSEKDPTTPTKKKRTISLSDPAGSTPKLSFASSSAFADDRTGGGAGLKAKSNNVPPGVTTMRSKAMEHLSSLSAAAGAAFQAEQARRGSSTTATGGTSSAIRSTSVPPTAAAPPLLQRTPSTCSTLSTTSSSAHRSTHSEAEAAETALLEQAEREHRERVARECEEWAKMVRCRVCVRTVLPSEADEEVEEKNRTVTPRRVVPSSSSGTAEPSLLGERQRTASDSQASESGASIASTESGASTRSDKTERGVNAAIRPAKTGAAASSSSSGGGMLDLRSLFAGYLGTDEAATSLPGHTASRTSTATATGSRSGAESGKKGVAAPAGFRLRSPVIWKPDVFQGEDLFGLSMSGPDIARASSSSTSPNGGGGGLTTPPDPEEEAQRVRVVGGTFFVRVQSEKEAVWVKRVLEVMLFAGCAMLLEAALLRDSGVPAQTRTRRRQQSVYARLGVDEEGQEDGGATLKGGVAAKGGVRRPALTTANSGRSSLGRSNSLGGARRRSLSRRISDAAAAVAATAAVATNATAAVSLLPPHLRREASDGGNNSRFRTSSVPSPVAAADDDESVSGSTPATPDKASSSKMGTASSSATNSRAGKRWSTKSLWSMIQTQAAGVTSPGGDGSTTTTAEGVSGSSHEGGGSGSGGGGTSGWIQRHNPLASTASAAAASMRSGLSRSGSERRRAERVSDDGGRVDEGGGGSSAIKAPGTPQSVRSSVDSHGSPFLQARRGSGGLGLRRALTKEEGGNSSSPSSPNRSSGLALKNSIGFPRTLSLRDSELGASPKERADGSTRTSGSSGAPHRLSNFGRMLKPFLMGSKGKADQNRIEEGSPLSESAPAVDEVVAEVVPSPKAKELPPWPAVAIEDLRWPPPLTTSPEIAKVIQGLSDCVEGVDHGPVSDGRAAGPVERSESFLTPFAHRQSITVLVEGKSDVITFAGTDVARPADRAEVTRSSDVVDVSGSAGAAGAGGSSAISGASNAKASTSGSTVASSTGASQTNTMTSTSGQSLTSQASNSTAATAETQATSSTTTSAKTAATTSTTTTTPSTPSASAATTNPFFHHASNGVQRHREEVAFYARSGRSRDLPLGQLIEEMCIRAVHAEAQLDELRALTKAVGGTAGSSVSGAKSGAGSGAGGAGGSAASGVNSGGGGKQSSSQTAKAAVDAANAILAGQVIHYLHGHHRITVSSKLIPETVLQKEQAERKRERLNKAQEGGLDEQDPIGGKAVAEMDVDGDADDLLENGDHREPIGTLSSVNESDVAAVAAALHTDPESARRAVLEASSALSLAEKTDLDRGLGTSGDKAEAGGLGFGGGAAAAGSAVGGVLTRSFRPPKSGFGVWMWEADVKSGKQSTPRIMSESTYLLSFAKYLEALVYHPALRMTQLDNSIQASEDDADSTINSNKLQRIKERLRRNSTDETISGSNVKQINIFDPAHEPRRFDVARMFRVGRALVKICVRPVTVYQLLIEGPVITLQGSPASGIAPWAPSRKVLAGGAGTKKNIPDPGRASFESARRIDIVGSGNVAGSSSSSSSTTGGHRGGQKVQFDDPDMEEARLEIQRFYAGVKDIISRLEDVLVERELDDKGVTIKRKPTESGSSDTLNAGGGAMDALSLLHRVKNGLREDEFDLYDVLKDSSSETINDVRKGLQDRAKSAKNRLQAWVKKHLNAAEITKLGPLKYEEPWYTVSNIHTFPGSRFVVREDEPLSIISFSLSSRDYRAELRSAGNGLEPGSQSVDKTSDVLQWRSGVADGSTTGSAFSNSVASSYSSRADRDRSSKGGPGGTGGGGGANGTQGLDPDRDHVFYEPEPVSVRMKRKRRGRDTSILSLTLRRVGSSVSASSGSGVPTPSNENGPLSSASGSGFITSSFGGGDSSIDSSGDGAVLGLGLGVSALDPTMLDLTSTPARSASRQRSQNEMSTTPTASLISSIGPGMGMTPTTMSGVGTGSTTTFKAQVTQVSGRPGSLASIFTKDSGTGISEGGETSMALTSSSSTASIQGRTDEERSGQGEANVAGSTTPASLAAVQTPTSASIAASGLNALWSMGSPFQSFKGGRQQPTALVGNALSPRVISEAATSARSSTAPADMSVSGSAQGGGAGMGPLPTSIPRAPAETPHVKHTVYHGTTKVSCVAWFAEEFAALRSKWGIGEDFLESLSRCNTWNAAGGKSKSQFFKTADDRFVAKQLLNVWNLDEMEAFLAFSPAYLRYAHNAVVNHCPSLLVKILGCYSIKIKHGDSVKLKMTLQIVENLFAGDEDEGSGLVRYDLKGIRERKVKSSSAADKDGSGSGDKGGPPPVWWDHEWIENCRPRAFVPESQREMFVAALKNDLAFLTESNVMDYSLLVGMYEPDVTSAELGRDLAEAEVRGDDEEEDGEMDEVDEEDEVGEEDNELGPKRRSTGKRRKTKGTRRCRQPMIRARIVDYIGAFTLAKQLESSSKKALKSGPEAKSNVTILPPSEYAERFGAAMLTAFTGCPDRTSPADLAASASSSSPLGTSSASVHLPSVF
ncbi:hypothetical protein CF319_g2563 [Tilletia indica]|nr:hypothetical protein CF319_g2563 [Tilletia indica]